MSFFESLPQPFPVLELRDKEAELSRKIQKGDEDALNELVLRNMREAILYTRCVSRNVEPGQLMSICYDALRRNAKRFDPARQRFFAFAKAGLRGALYRNYNKEIAPSRVKHEELLPLTEKKIARKDSSEVVTDMPDYEPVRKDQIVEPDMEGVFTRDRWELVKPVVEQSCSAQEKMVLNLTYVSGLNFQEIGGLLGVTRSAIQRTHWRAVKKLRSVLSRRKQLLDL